MPCDYSKYPPNWKEIRARILERAENKCEWCAAINYEPHPITGSKVVLTIAHVGPTKHDKMDCRDEALFALCQKCHLNEDRDEHITNRAKNLRETKEREGQINFLK